MYPISGFKKHFALMVYKLEPKHFEKKTLPKLCESGQTEPFLAKLKISAILIKYPICIR